MTKSLLFSLGLAMLLTTGCGTTGNDRKAGDANMQPHPHKTNRVLKDWTWEVDATLNIDNKGADLSTYYYDNIPSKVVNFQIFIDAIPNKGFNGSDGWEVFGADYLIEDGGLFKSQSDTEWKWQYLGAINLHDNHATGSDRAISFNNSKLLANAISAKKVNIYIESYDKNWVGEYFTIPVPNVDVKRDSPVEHSDNLSLPPAGIAIAQAPMFVVIGFDDNTEAAGIDWAMNLFENKRNRDGSAARVSFYMNTVDFGSSSALVNSVKRLNRSSHEIGNHTRTHHDGLTEDEIKYLSQSRWKSAIANASADLTQKVGVEQRNIQGFRAPYLLYNQNLLRELKSQGFLYDCSIEEGYAPNFDGTNFRWPYRLDNGSPGHNENWYGRAENPNHISISGVSGLWELPNHVFMVPKDSECAKYGISRGLWDRLRREIPYLSDYKITGFDYNLWSTAKLNKSEVLGILKYNLDLRLRGNRAPFMLGAHTQFYVGDWAAHHAPNATSKQMREAISEFVNYALSKDAVRIRPGKEIIEWCSNPTPIN